eukprot:CAMPEP_0168519084 /NCGR_PEP_ID=MMETSP0405-20121227/7106_1 /TAXON_ID=498012 /ORGANISM="Trichosphaerium sp, Strain Am-I-7 wt" /LENGTH=232 /DNA_ID=CAMNT_0008539557 /DNA_START=125 /DNA_END=820 /DNA_ORIENTATION=-
MIRASFIILIVVTCAICQQENNVDVSVWDSTLQVDWSKGIVFPIGGSGQVNGAFCTVTYRIAGQKSLIQLGLRVQNRTGVGAVPLTQNVYNADTGVFGEAAALWNIDLHVDSGTEFLGKEFGVPDIEMVNMRGSEWDALFRFDIDPSPDKTNYIDIYFDEFYANATNAPFIGLIQDSVPPTSPPYEINPRVDGDYNFMFVLLNKGEQIASVTILCRTRGGGIVDWVIQKIWS